MCTTYITSPEADVENLTISEQAEGSLPRPPLPNLAGEGPLSDFSGGNVKFSDVREMF